MECSFDQCLTMEAIWPTPKVHHLKVALRRQTWTLHQSRHFAHLSNLAIACLPRNTLTLWWLRWLLLPSQRQIALANERGELILISLSWTNAAWQIQLMIVGLLLSVNRHKVGFPGLACKHCFGGNGSGRFFPLTLKTFSDVSKSLHVLRNHLVKCAKAPASLSAKVSRLYDQHYNDKVRKRFHACHCCTKLAPQSSALHTRHVNTRAQHLSAPRRYSLIMSGEGCIQRCMMNPVNRLISFIRTIQGRKARHQQIWANSLS